MTNDDVKILVVDDEARNLDALEVMLEPMGCAPVRALSADEALLALLKHEFAAMILDIKMPGLSGIDLARLVKQRRRTQDVPILFLTAHLIDDEDVLRGYGVGAVDYLSKPVNPDILRSKVAVFVELHRKTRALEAVNARLQAEIAERERAQAALQQMNEELELRVAERTAALSLVHRAVQADEERLRLAMGVAEIAAWEFDVASDTLRWSVDPEQLFGLPAGWLGDARRLTEALHPDDRSRVEATVAEAIARGTTYDCEYRIVRPDGSTVWITERGRALVNDDARVEKVIGVSRDVSAQRRAELERERLLVSERAARDEAERQSRLKDDFLATLSHELRTPMNAILGWLSMLASENAVRDPEQAMAAIRRNATLQAKLIEDLLEMNKLTSGTVRLELAPLDLSSVVKAALQALQPAADTKGVALSGAVGPDVPVIVADERRVQQILWNLLHNAVKFTPSGGRVSVDVTCDGGALCLQVSDTGQGIPLEFLPFVFDRFRQADPSTTRGSWGLGIGLSIAKHLVELHGGTIAASSDGEDRGAVFVVRLPIAAAQARRERTDAGTLPAGVTPVIDVRRATV